MKEPTPQRLFRVDRKGEELLLDVYGQMMREPGSLENRLQEEDVQQRLRDAVGDDEAISAERAAHLLTHAAGRKGERDDENDWKYDDLLWRGCGKHNDIVLFVGGRDGAMGSTWSTTATAYLYQTGKEYDTAKWLTKKRRLDGLGKWETTLRWAWENLDGYPLTRLKDWMPYHASSGQRSEVRHLLELLYTPGIRPHPTSARWIAFALSQGRYLAPAEYREDMLRSIQGSGVGMGDELPWWRGATVEDVLRITYENDGYQAEEIEDLLRHGPDARPEPGARKEEDAGFSVGELRSREKLSDWTRKYLEALGKTPITMIPDYLQKKEAKMFMRTTAGRAEGWAAHEIAHAIAHTVIERKPVGLPVDDILERLEPLLLEGAGKPAQRVFVSRKGGERAAEAGPWSTPASLYLSLAAVFGESAEVAAPRERKVRKNPEAVRAIREAWERLPSRSVHFSNWSATLELKELTYATTLIDENTRLHKENALWMVGCAINVYREEEVLAAPELLAALRKSGLSRQDIIEHGERQMMLADYLERYASYRKVAKILQKELQESKIATNGKSRPKRSGPSL